MAFIEPLDLQTLLVNTLSGNYVIFTFLILIVIAALAARFRMPGPIALIMFVIFAIIFDGTNSVGLYAFIMILTALFVFYSIPRLIKN